jgi:hypothetical protein
MLIKLIKHDLIATKHEFFGIYLGYLLLSIIAPFLIQNGPEWLQVLSVFAVAGVLIAIIVITLLAIIRLFQKRLYSHEGYLTWTLPVSTKLNLVSKVIVGVIWNVASFVVVWVGAIIAALIYLSQTGAYNEVLNILNVILVETGFLMKMVQLGVVFLPQSLVSIFYSVIFLLFVITFVNTSWIKKGRTGIGVVLYFGLALVIDAISSLLITKPAIVTNIGPDGMMINPFDPINSAVTALSNFSYSIDVPVVLATIAFHLAIIILMSIGVLYFVEKKMEIE